MMDQFLKYFIWLATRAATAYLLVFLFFFCLINPARSKVAALNQDRLAVDYLYDFSERRVPADPRKFRQYKRYYERLVKYVQDNSAAYGMIGYIEYYLGNTDKAIQAYKKAVGSEPRFFWFHYNLGSIYFQKGDYVTASAFFDQASQTAVPESAYYMAKSKVYQVFLSKLTISDKELMDRFRKAYSQCYVMLVLIYYHLNDFPRVAHYATKGLASSKDNQAFFDYYLGMSKYYLKDYAKAIFFLQESIHLDPDQPEAFRYLSLTLEIAGNHQLAEQAMKKSKSILKPQPSLEKEIRVSIF